MSSSSLAALLGELKNPAPKDFDLEAGYHVSQATMGNASESDYGEQEDEEQHNPRAHYLDVGKSVLRKKSNLSEHERLSDPKYRGVKATRDELYAEEHDQASDDEQASDHDDEQSEEEDDQPSGSKKQLLFADQSDSDDHNEAGGTTIASQLKESQKLTKQLKVHRVEDAEKGRNVRRQIKVWERSLEARIKAQSVMRNLNLLPDPQVYPTMMDQETQPTLTLTIDNLLSLSDTLFELRTKLYTINNGVQLTSRKRKRTSDPKLEGSIFDLLSLQAEMEPQHHIILDKWSTKVSAAASSNKFALKAVNQSPVSQITSSLSGDAYARLLERTRQSRSHDASTKIGAILSNQNGATRQIDQQVFDDTDFYSQLLRELIERRGANHSVGPTRLHGNKKIKPTVDTKASKGRRLRYDVNEKVQNFMPPIPSRLRWTEEQIDRLFAQLAGEQPPESPQPSSDLSGLKVFG